MAWSWCVPFGWLGAGAWVANGDLPPRCPPPFLGFCAGMAGTTPVLAHAVASGHATPTRPGAPRGCGTQKASPSPQPTFHVQRLDLRALACGRGTMEGGAPHLRGVQRPLAQALERPGVSGPFPPGRAGDLGGLRRVGIHPTGQGRHLHPPHAPRRPFMRTNPSLASSTGPGKRLVAWV